MSRRQKPQLVEDRVGKIPIAAAPVPRQDGCDPAEAHAVARAAARAIGPEVRWGLVARVKAEIAAGTYETEERLAASMDRLMEELFPRP